MLETEQGTLNMSGTRERETDIDDILNLAEDNGNRLADDRNSVEETGLSDENVKENLVDADELLRFGLAAVVGPRSGNIIPRGKHRRWHRSELRRGQGACPASGKWQSLPSR
jgi:hypothetical protein